MDRITINAEKREEFGKGAARGLRRNNMIPAIIYRGGGSLPLKFSKKELDKFIKKTRGAEVMVNLQFADGESRLAFMKDYQVDPVKGELLHADFFEVSLTEEVKVTVHITAIGDSIGVKRDGGILQYLLREIEVECLPDKIPGHIETDISGLEIGQSVRVSDLKVGEGIKILSNPEEVIVNVIAPAVEAAPPAEAAVAAPEVTEPEVTKKGKKEEKEAEESK